MKLARIAALALVGAATASTAHAFDLFFDFNRNAVGGAANSSVFLFGNASQQATVSNLAGFNQTVTLNAQGFFNLPISNIYQQSGTGTLNTGFNVNSANAIAGYFVNRAPATTDMTYLLDSAALGTNYIVASQGGGFGEGSQVAIHATANATNVTFTPSGGAPINVTLNAGQTYKYAGGSTNLTGSSVVASAPVAVFGGHECTQVPLGVTACDTLLEQMIPTDKLSKNYAISASQAASVSQTKTDLVRVIATVDATQVKVNGVVVATINKGQFHEFQVAQNTGASIEGSNAIMVAQYLTGAGNGALTDPAMSLVPGSDTWLADYRLATPSGSQDFATDWASIVINTTDLASLKLDNVAVNTSGCTPIAGTPYSRCHVTLPNGLFNLTAGNPFQVMLGGGSSFDSYFTYGGATFAPGISPPTSTPEPATLALFGVSLLGLAAARRRR